MRGLQLCCLHQEDPHPHLGLEPLFLAMTHKNVHMMRMLLKCYRSETLNLSNNQQTIFFFLFVPMTWICYQTHRANVQICIWGQGSNHYSLQIYYPEHDRVWFLVWFFFFCLFIILKSIKLYQVAWRQAFQIILLVKFSKQANNVLSHSSIFGDQFQSKPWLNTNLLFVYCVCDQTNATPDNPTSGGPSETHSGNQYTLHTCTESWDSGSHEQQHSNTIFPEWRLQTLHQSMPWITPWVQSCEVASSQKGHDLHPNGRGVQGMAGIWAGFAWWKWWILRIVYLAELSLVLILYHKGSSLTRTLLQTE